MIRGQVDLFAFKGEETSIFVSPHTNRKKRVEDTDGCGNMKAVIYAERYQYLQANDMLHEEWNVCELTLVLFSFSAAPFLDILR